MNKLIKTLNKEQRDVVLNSDGPSLVIAGPGSGKTRTLTHKIAYLIREKKVHPEEIFAVTFTNKAAGEMKERVHKLLKEGDDLSSGFSEDYLNVDKIPSWIGTFHSICARILRIESSKSALNSTLDVDKNFVIYDTDDSKKLIKDILNEIGVSARDISPTSILSTISRAKGEMLDPANFRAKSSGSYFFQKVVDVYPMYQKKLRDNNALDFGDLLFETVKLFRREKEILEFYQNRFRYILVDEYQDTNKVQYSLVKMLASKHKNLTVVGDVSQSIYSWRGANYRNVIQFEKDYPHASIFRLAQNYRSTENILNAAKVLIENNRTHMPIDLYTRNNPGEQIKLFEAEHERAEAQYIADMISFLGGSSNGYEMYPEANFNNFAVLYRTNAQSRAIEEALMYAGIPYRIIGGVRFYDRKEIKDVIAYLRVFHNPKDTVSWARCINTPPRGVGKKTMQQISDARFDLDLVEKVTNKNWKRYVNKGQKGAASPIELLDAILKYFGYLDYLNDGTEESLYRIENLKELRTVARQYDSLSELLETIALVESSDRADNMKDNAVVLMTLHSAKGLEFENVFITGMEEGLFPHSKSMTDPDELEEERRLCYVGMTRAKKNLFLTYTRRRTYFGSTGASMISRFISEIPEELIEFRFS